MWHNGALWFSDLMGNKMYSLSADGTLSSCWIKAGGLDSFPAGAYGGSNAMVADRDGTVLMMQHSAAAHRAPRRQAGRHAVLDGTTKASNSTARTISSSRRTAPCISPIRRLGCSTRRRPTRISTRIRAASIAFNGVYRYQGGKLAAVITDLHATQWIGLLARRKDSLRREQRESRPPTIATTSSQTACSDRDNSSRT